MKALTLLQPWAALVVHNIKDIENRTWRTKVRGNVLIHASKKANQYLIDKYVEKWPEISETVKITGAIIGMVNITRCVKRSSSVWFTGPYGFKLKDAVIRPPIQARGMLKFWNYDYFNK